MIEKEPEFESREKKLEVDFDKLRKEQLEKHEEAARESEAKSPESIEHILEKIEKEARPAKTEDLSRHDNKDREESPANIGKQLRDTSLNQTLAKTRRKLPPAQRAFSKVVHNPGVDAISNAASVSVARPSGLLFGGIFSVIGSLGVLIICRYYGYEYNFLIGTVCFVGGFFAGLLLELLLKAFRRAH